MRRKRVGFVEEIVDSPEVARRGEPCSEPRRLGEEERCRLAGAKTFDPFEQLLCLRLVAEVERSLDCFDEAEFDRHHGRGQCLGGGESAFRRSEGLASVAFGPQDPGEPAPVDAPVDRVSSPAPRRNRRAPGLGRGRPGARGAPPPHRRRR